MVTGELNLRRLRVFAAVARTGSFAAAADALTFTPSAVSQQMSRLEAEVGARLVNRGSRGVVLTCAGEALLVRAERILEEACGAQADLRALREGEPPLRVGSFPRATATVLAPALRTLRTTRPDLVVDVRDDRWPEADVVLTDDGRDGVPLWSDPLVLVVPDVHPLSAHDLVPVPTTGLLDGVTDPAAVAALVTAGLGLGLLPAACPPAPGTAHVPTDARRTVTATFPTGRPVHPAASALVDLLRTTDTNRPTLRAIA